MPGGLLQLKFKGSQDLFLTNKPQISYFKSSYKRHSNFSIETREEKFINGGSFGQTVECTIPRYGDLLSQICLFVELPGFSDRHFRWTKSIGHVIIEQVELLIGENVIDKQTGELMEILTELTTSKSKEPGYNSLVGRNGSSNPMQLYVPLKFWFCQHISQSIPLIALQYHDVKIRIKLADFSKCWTYSNNQLDNIGIEPRETDLNVSLLVDYIYLDVLERKRFAKSEHSYLIQQTQYCNQLIKGENANIDLMFNHPIIELIWVLQRTNVSETITDQFQIVQKPNYHFDYHLDLDVLSDSFDTGVLYINGNQRFKPRNASYFRLYIPWQRHTRVPSKLIYCYSFSLRPEDYQPSGSCNFSRIDNAKLTLSFTKNKEMKNIKIFARNYNILLINQGMGGLIFST